MEQNQALPKHVWILDSLPGAYDQSRDRASRQSVSGIINTVANLPAEFPSKEWVIGELQSKGIQRDIALWLAMNVIPAEEGDMFKFSFDIDTIVELFADYCKVDAWDFLHSYKGTAKLQFIRAGRNDLWTPEVLSRFESLQRQNPNIVLHTMPHVGHWLHSEDMKGTLKIVSDNSR
jgi:pimeloyl-ACP methyl ester carboxylesterase